MMVLNMARQGVFGELTYAEGAYIHDCRYLLFTDRDQPTWRAQLRRSFQGNTYPTHSLGPAAQWLGIGRDGDRMVSTATWMAAGVCPTLCGGASRGPSRRPRRLLAAWRLGDDHHPHGAWARDRPASGLGFGAPTQHDALCPPG
jgi:hypothetical protein